MEWIEYKNKLPNDGQQIVSGFYNDSGVFIQFMDVFNLSVWKRKKDNEKSSHWHKLNPPPNIAQQSLSGSGPRSCSNCISYLVCINSGGLPKKRICDKHQSAA
jgi:hypothetical protein